MNFSDVYGLVRDEFPAFPVGLAKSYLLEALKDFCEETWIYHEWDTFLTTAGTYEYTLTPSDSNTRVIGLFQNGVQLSTVYTPNPTASDSTDAGTLTVANTYVYKVTSYSDDYGETLPCDAVSHVCPATGAIDLDWDDVEDADGYYIYRNDGVGGTTYGLLDSATSSTYTDDGSATVTATTTPPTKSELVKYINLSSGRFEAGADAYWRTRESDNIDAIVWDGNVTVRTNTIPETTNMFFQVKIALTFTEETTIPDILIPYKTALQDYIKYKIYRHPKTKDIVWNDRDAARDHYSMYRATRAAAKMKVIGGFGGPMVVRPQPFV